MPRINDQIETYPKGYFLGENDLTIPANAKFVIAQAADGYKGTVNAPNTYVFDNWPAQVQAAYDANVLIGAQLTLRVAGNDYQIDYGDIDADRQFQGFMAALNNRVYGFIVLRVVSTDSDVAAVKAANYFGDKLRKRTGKRVFLQAYESLWKNSEHWDVALGNASSIWSLLIICDYETETGAAIETPGLWNTSKGLIWEQSGGVYRGWPPFADWYDLTGDPVEPTPVEPTPVEPTPVGPVYDDDLTAQIYGLRRDLRKIFAGLEPL